MGVLAVREKGRIKRGTTDVLRGLNRKHLFN